jgi:hypothetical protein
MPYHRSYTANWLLAVPLLLVAAAGYAQTRAEQTFDLDAFWRRPLAAQGDAPAQWSPLERSLMPADCGQCHADVLAQWQSSRHAHAFSPGLLAQLIGNDDAGAAECMQCHAPLAEQREAFLAARARGVADRFDEDGLAAAGNSCGGCHVRHNSRFGPPQRGSGATGPSQPIGPHGGALRTAAFERSEFCSSCHQFSADTAVNGKPLENTYEEWRASPQAAQGIVCQTCHMPDRAHLWRGIHDPTMVAKGLTANITADAETARFELVNSGVGHAFPTYTVPTVVMNLVALDADGAARPQTLRSHVIARRVRYDDAANSWIELSDARLLPGQSSTIELAWNGSERIRAWLEVIPDDFYATQVFPELIASLPANGEALRLANEALAAARASPFRLFETELRRP